MLIKVICSTKIGFLSCCNYEENYTITEDKTMEDLKFMLKVNGWTTIGEDYFCPNCSSGL